jgi:transcriptional regulator with XRE-family HTH domain
MYKPEEAKLFGAAIKQFLTERKLSQRQFAKQAGLDASYVSKLVNPKPGKEIAEPRKEIRQQLAKGLGLTEQELVEYIEQYRNLM